MSPRCQRALVVAAAVVLAACGGSDSKSNVTNPPPVQGDSAISVRDNSFSPSTTTVKVGTTITWTWSGANPHDVAFDDGVKSATQTSGTYARLFSAAGTYRYHCQVHGQAMSGAITVQQ